MWYNIIEDKERTSMARKRRNDRNHVIYKLTAPTGEEYVGVTFARGRAFKRSARIRFDAHCRNAFDYGHKTLLATALLEHGREMTPVLSLRFWRMNPPKVRH